MNDLKLPIVNRSQQLSDQFVERILVRTHIDLTCATTGKQNWSYVVKYLKYDSEIIVLHFSSRMVCN